MTNMPAVPPGYLHRTLEPVIERVNRRFKGVIVTGMRQVGKRTMLCAMKDDARKSLNLDRLEILELARGDREAFFRKFPFPVLIEEFHRAPELALEIKALLDETNDRGLVWMTVSQKPGIIKAVPEALSGRAAYFELFPLSLYEQQGKGLEQKPFLPRGDLGRGTLNPLTVEEIWDIIWQGSWPEHIHDEPEERDAFYDSLLRTYIQKDVFSSGVRRIEDFDRFLSILATRIGQEFAIGEVQKEAGIAAETARAWLNVAEATGVIYLLPPFYENVGKTLIKKHKLYFTDTGFAAWLCKSPSPQALRKTYNAGAFFENFVVMEIVKSWKHNGKRPLFYFYRDAQRNEMDLLIREGETYYPIEIKTTDSPQRRMLDINIGTK